MNAQFVKAFDVWEREFRANPSAFMTAEECAAAELLPLAQQRAVYFEAILNKEAEMEEQDETTKEAQKLADPVDQPDGAGKAEDPAAEEKPADEKASE